MAEIKPFTPAKLICGIISGRDIFFREGEERLTALFGPVDIRSQTFDFDLTDYYEPQMGKGLKRLFLAFEQLVNPERLSEIKLRTNELEEEIGGRFGEALRHVNIDPGILTASALIMATAKNFSHRIPLRQGIYGHLEFLFTKAGVKTLDWTYPDFRKVNTQAFFGEVRRNYLSRLKSGPAAKPGSL